MNVGIIGCGTMGNIHAEMAKQCGMKIIMCSDPVQKAGKTLAKKFKSTYTKNWEEVIFNKEIDIVVIATPTPFHFPILQLATKNGKHIFCEKPLCRTTKECHTILKQIEKSKTKLFVAHVVRYFHEFEALHEQIKAGKIGSVGFVKMYRGGASPKGWFSDFRQSGGVTFDCIIHDLDWLRYVFGEVDTVFCQNLIERGIAPIDYSQVTVRMKNGVLALVIGTWAHPSGFRVKVELCGSEGLIYYDSLESPIEFYPRSLESVKGTIVPASPVMKSPYLKEWEDFLSWINYNQEPRVTPLDGMKAVEIVEACLKSAKMKQPIRL